MFEEMNKTVNDFMEVVGNITDKSKEIKEYVEQNTSDDTFFVQVRPEDYLSRFYLHEDWLSKINQSMPDKYKGKMIGLRRERYDGHFFPVFDKETQKEWDKELKDYISRKAAWCKKHERE